MSSSPSENGAAPLIPLNTIGLGELSFSNMTETQVGASIATLGDINDDDAIEFAATSRITAGYPSALFIILVKTEPDYKATQLAKIDLLPVLGAKHQSVSADGLEFFSNPGGQFGSPRAQVAVDLDAAPHSIHSVGDVNEDGVADLLLAVSEDYIVLYLNSDETLKS